MATGATEMELPITEYRFSQNISSFQFKFFANFCFFIVDVAQAEIDIQSAREEWENVTLTQHGKILNTYICSINI